MSQSNIPLQAESATTKLGWLREAVSEGRYGLEQCQGFASLDEDLELISRHAPVIDPQNPDFHRRLSLPLTKSRVSDIVSTLANLRQLWQISSGVSELQQPAKILNKSSWAWWRKTDADLAILSALQYSAVQRTGYLWLKYNPHYYGLNDGELVPIPLGPKWVYYLGMPQDYNYQQAYATIICEVVPITQARSDYPMFADRLKPTTDSTLQSYGFLRRMYNRIARGVDSMMDGAPPEERRDFLQNVPGVLIYHMYTRDLTMNQSGREVIMGTPDNPKFQYTVPYLGQQIPSGMVEPATALDVMRRAQPEDIYLYPRRRYTCFTDTDILYDGPSKEFHGRSPIVKFTLDPWPWDFLGGSMVGDIRSIDEAMNRRLRGIEKAAELRRNPPTMGNVEQIADSEQGELAYKIDEPGGRIKVDFRLGDPIRPILPYQHYDVQSWEYEFIKELDGFSDFVSGRAAFEALARARQMPSGDTQEKFLQLTSSRTTAKSRSIERSMCDLGYLVMCGILQYWNSRKRFSLNGFQGVTDSDFDKDTGTLIPFTYQPEGLIPSDISINEPDFKMDYRSKAFSSRSQRAQAMIKQFSLEIEPLSAHDLTSMTRQLLYTRLYEGMHFPIDSWSYAEVMNISNMGTPPETENDTMPERFMVESDIRSQAMAMMQAKAQMTMAQANPQAVIQQAIQQDPQGVLQMVLQAIQQSGGGGNGGSSEGGGSNGATGRPEGHPPSYQDSPKLFNRSDGNGGQRTVLTTSKTSGE
jgi:hypothetical protein